MTEREIFTAALNKSDPADRAAYLDEVCAGDADLHKRIASLLAEHAQLGSFLESPATERPPVLTSDATAGIDASPSPESEMPFDFLRPSQQPGHLGRLGHYEVVEVIGRGGMGIVLRAIDDKLLRAVAIKVMAAPWATNATARKRFMREAQAAAAVTHDHVVTIHAVEEAGGLPYLAMQYVAGVSLQQRLDKSGPLELREIVRIGMQTAAGLAAAHAQGLIHRDIKPANILLENGVERVKITDFGLARAVADASMTQTGKVAGTPQYMSPEQAHGEMVDRRSDLFSLGSVLYAMCTGRPPFRADSGIAVLKRVCDETPRPIREFNPDIPKWLEALIARLHAKDPAQRYQSAAEVTEVLGRRLAELQHPSVAALPAAKQGVRRLSASSSSRWAIAAAVLLCLLAGLGMAEGTGVTNLASTVIRLLTPEGTLVIEVDDENVTMQLDGEELSIKGAGPHEIRLQPGQYKLRASKAGKIVKQELISITRGGKQVMKVELEGAAVATEVTLDLPTEKNAFVLSGVGIPERKFDTLADVVRAASGGDTIEVRGNGPFVSQPVTITGTPLTIRAGQGFRPVIRLDSKQARAGDALLETSGTLCVEGVELQVIGPPSQEVKPYWPILLRARGADAQLFLTNCRFVHDQVDGAPIWASHVAVLDVRNSQFVSQSSIIYSPARDSRITLHHNLIAADPFGVNLPVFVSDAQEVAVDLKHNTLVAPIAVQFYLDFLPEAVKEPEGQAIKAMRIQASGNLFQGAPSVLRFEQSSRFLEKHKELSVAEMKTLLRRMVDWQGERNGFPARTRFLDLVARGTPLPSTMPSETIADWNAFWGIADAQCIQGPIRFAGGDLLEKSRTAPKLLVPEDFRLRPNSAGYHAGSDGKDLGADLDRVGPGPAYEHWKKNPEYQDWLIATGQLK